MTTPKGYRRYAREFSSGEFVENRIPTSPTPTKLKLLLAERYWKGHGYIAQQLGISGATFSRYVNGTVPISSEHLVRLCRFFRVGPNDILGFAELYIDIPA